MRALGIRSAMVVPLCVHGRALGAITFASATPARRYDNADLTLADELTHRGALAVENARLYRQAQDAVRARETFIAIASHELRTPLTPLMLLVQNLIRTLRQPSEPPRSDNLVRVLEAVDRQTTRLEYLVNELLDVSRLTSGRFHLVREELDLQAKPIEISLAAQANAASFRVRDHGIGISPEDQARIFERFERAVSDTHYGGLGLGLFITQQIVAAHGGTISVESTVGEGATFTVMLPRASQTQEAQAP